MRLILQKIRYLWRHQHSSLNRAGMGSGFLVNETNPGSVSGGYFFPSEKGHANFKLETIYWHPISHAHHLCFNLCLISGLFCFSKNSLIDDSWQQCICMYVSLKGIPINDNVSCAFSQDWLSSPRIVRRKRKLPSRSSTAPMSRSQSCERLVRLHARSVICVMS